jgi:hypothetical protein
MRICCELIAHQYFLLIPFEPTNHLEFIDMAAVSRMCPLCPLARFFPFLSSRHNTNNYENAQQALNKIIAL